MRFVFTASIGVYFMLLSIVIDSPGAFVLFGLAVIASIGCALIDAWVLHRANRK